MEKENEDIQSEDEIVEPEEVAEGDEDTTDWKALALKNQGIAKRLKTKLEKQKEIKPEIIPDKPEKPNDLTDGQKALFVSYGIKGKDEIALGKELMERLNLNSVESLIEDDYFQSRLTKLRDAKASQEAIPSSTGRSPSTQGNRLDYWVAKYSSSGNLNEVPKELQREVLNARLKSEEQVKKFG